MTTTEIVSGICALLGAGGIGSFATFRLGNRKQNTNDFSTIIEKYEGLYSKLENKVEVLEKKVEDLTEREAKYKEEVAKLRNQLLIFEGSHIDLPLPMWMKDAKGDMIFINSYYEDAFLLPRGKTIRDYVGFNDYAVWNKEIADAFVKHDKEIARTKQSKRYIEALEDENGATYYVEVLKYPRMLNNVIIGISGIILKTAKTKESLK